MPTRQKATRYLVPVGSQMDGGGDVYEQAAAQIAEDSLDAAERHEVDDHDESDNGQQDERGDVQVEEKL